MSARMSKARIGTIIAQRFSAVLTPSERAVLAQIKDASWPSEDKASWSLRATQGQLAEQLGVTRETVSRSVRRLKRVGLIDAVRTGKASVYTLTVTE